MPQPDSGFRNVSLPRALLDRVEKLPPWNFGYTSLADLVKDAVRRRCDELEARKPRRRSR